MALDVFREPLVEFFVGIKQCGHDEVQQGPQLRDSNDILVSNSTSSHRPIREREKRARKFTHLGHGVLDGRSREKQSVSTLELQQDFPAHAGNSSGKETTARVSVKSLIHFSRCQT